jgi:UDP-N-acetylmuramoyl-L-alanyl-D-glutamate--2,6-diaminopimelate ligase
MLLARLLDGVVVTKMFQSLYGKMVMSTEVDVRGIQYDSRKIGRSEMFVAIRGTATDGHRFIGSAVHNGASVVVMQEDAAMDDAFFLHEGVTKIVVPDSRKALATMAANYYGHPSRRLELVGVTGTNGKTTTTHLVKSILEVSGKRVGLIGTIDYKVGDEVIHATHTTPESLEVNQLLASMVDKGCTAAVMEVSSHALAMSRVYGLAFKAATFTNLTQDHLDFHGSMEEYFRAKKLLFDGLTTSAVAITNADDQYGGRIVEGTQARTITYSTVAEAEVEARNIHLDVRGSRFTIFHDGSRQDVVSVLTGRFNIANMTAAYATALALGISEEHILSGIALVKSVRGRFERIVSPRRWTAIVDYAHTPDALENCLRTVHDLLPSGRTSRIITVFGCGGNRDRGKRPTMGNIAATLSDITIVTSDNPRTEDPSAIIEEITTGIVKGKQVYTEVDRRKAIVLGLGLAKPGDVVLIAGKGHEDYQVIGDATLHFDDREEVESYIRNNAWT